VELVEEFFGCDYTGFFGDVFSPFLVLALFIDHMDLGIRMDR
jgi:hypothetical protein